MNREYHRWYSPSLERDMELLIFGHAGARVLAFPTSRAHFYEWEDFGMVNAMRDYLDQGWFQLWCVDSVDAESWLAGWKHPADRAARHAQYDRYLVSEVVPLMAHRNPHPYLITTGASFGAYHAANFAFKYPHLVGRMIGLSGWYDIRRFTGGYSDDNVYYNNPPDFLQGEHDPQRLDALKSQDIVLVVGRDDYMVHNNEHLSSILWSKGIWHALRVWDGWYHDWPYWHQMIRMYIHGGA
ncbi:MAG: alpha/beta hydrolase-fold protein [Chloroflexota bacterium]|nr:alpha/beta hydrolase-fold protein [Chloroflexota bacterium]